MIKTIGLFRNKAKNVIKLSRLLIDNFDGEVPVLPRGLLPPCRGWGARRPMWC
jgi:endonuclease III